LNVGEGVGEGSLELFRLPPAARDAHGDLSWDERR
jgi:hypothetical protein